MFKLVVLSCVLAAASASGLFRGYVAPISPLTYAAPLIQPYNYRGPLSLAPGQPANILGADGRPLDTLDVNLDRSAHLTAKALDSGFHLLKKRSIVSPIIAPYSASIVAPLAYSAPLLQPYNYRGPLSLAPGQPANILGSDGRPLDTLDVNLDRSAHFTAKALDNGFHLLKKRSIVSPIIAPYSASIVAPLAYSAPLLQPYNYRGPLSLAPGQPANILGADGRPLDTLDVNLDRAAHYTSKALSEGVHLLKKRSAPLIAPISTVAIARTPLIAAPFAYTAPIATAHYNPISYAAAPITHIF